jgi:hypothetical protein
MQANTNNVNKTWALLQTSGGKNELHIVIRTLDLDVKMPDDIITIIVCNE